MLFASERAELARHRKDSMRSLISVGALLVGVVACGRTNQSEVEAPSANAAPTRAAAAPANGNRLFLDVHELGPGNVTLAAAAGAHQKDLETQGKHGANFKAYWVDEKAGKIYCLVEAPSAEAALATHKEAHGLMPTSIEEVSAGR